jgi:hypothetical protein
MNPISAAALRKISASASAGTALPLAAIDEVSYGCTVITGVQENPWHAQVTRH